MTSTGAGAGGGCSDAGSFLAAVACASAFCVATKVINAVPGSSGGSVLGCAAGAFSGFGSPEGVSLLGDAAGRGLNSQFLYVTALEAVTNPELLHLSAL